jgi:hypothetical protein
MIAWQNNAEGWVNGLLHWSNGLATVERRWPSLRCIRYINAHTTLIQRSCNAHIALSLRRPRASIPHQPLDPSPPTLYHRDMPTQKIIHLPKTDLSVPGSWVLVTGAEEHVKRRRMIDGRLRMSHAEV